jgi:primosomal protein N'
MSAVTDLRWNPFRRHELGGIVEESTQSVPVPPRSKSKTWETTVERVPSWPEEARQLKNHTWLTYLYVIGDFLLVLLPLFFIRKSRAHGCPLISLLTHDSSGCRRCHTKRKAYQGV